MVPAPAGETRLSIKVATLSPDISFWFLREGSARSSVFQSDDSFSVFCTCFVHHLSWVVLFLLGCPASRIWSGQQNQVGFAQSISPVPAGLLPMAALLSERGIYLLLPCSLVLEYSEQVKQAEVSACSATGRGSPAAPPVPHIQVCAPECDAP